jgi:hypothetical protein
MSSLPVDTKQDTRLADQGGAQFAGPRASTRMVDRLPLRRSQGTQGTIVF